MSWIALLVGWLLMEPIIPTGHDAQCLERGYVWADTKYIPYCIERSFNDRRN